MKKPFFHTTKKLINLEGCFSLTCKQDVNQTSFKNCKHVEPSDTRAWKKKHLNHIYFLLEKLVGVIGGLSAPWFGKSLNSPIYLSILDFRQFKEPEGWKEKSTSPSLTDSARAVSGVFSFLFFTFQQVLKTQQRCCTGEAAGKFRFHSHSATVHFVPCFNMKQQLPNKLEGGIIKIQNPEQQLLEETSTGSKQCKTGKKKTTTKTKTNCLEFCTQKTLTDFEQ